MAPKFRAQQENEVKILAFGDSLTEGYTNFGRTFHPYADALKESLHKLLPEDFTIKVDVEGVSGDCVLTSLGGDFADRLGAALTDDDYDLVIILGGTNDLAYKFDSGLEGADEIFDNGLRPLYDYVLETTKASLLVMTVPQRAIDVTQRDAWDRKARESREYLNKRILTWVGEQKENVFAMDLAALVPFPVAKDEGGDRERDVFEGSCWSPDGLHMSVKGYNTVGELLAERIVDLMKSEE